MRFKEYFLLLLVGILIGLPIGFLLSSSPENLPPVVEVQASTTYGEAPLEVHFTSQVEDPDGKIIGCTWDFDDGTYSNDKNVTHIFYQPGVFRVMLTARDNSNETTSASIKIIVFNRSTPIAIASATPTYGKAPLKVRFNATGFDPDGKIVSYQWIFGDGETSNERNPIHEYKEEGLYHPVLIVIDSDGLKDTYTLEIKVNENIPPIARASADKLSGRAPLTIHFSSDESRDLDGTITTCTWEIERAMLSNKVVNGKNAAHTFWFPGVYKVKLTVADNDGAEDTDILVVEVKENLVLEILNTFKTIKSFLKIPSTKPHDLVVYIGSG